LLLGALVIVAGVAVAAAILLVPISDRCGAPMHATTVTTSVEERYPSPFYGRNIFDDPAKDCHDAGWVRIVGAVVIEAISILVGIVLIAYR
jgi:hypothetical protein